MTRAAARASVLALVACALPACAPSVVAPGAGAAGPAAGALATTAEASGYTATSSYADVAAFLAAMDGLSDAVHTTSFGTSGEGRALPLVVWGAPDATPAAIRATGKTRVLVVAAIHGGEVAGKEAALALVRDLAHGRHAGWADSLVVLVAPLYNADGNERVAPGNRPLQLGPDAGMGQRANADGLDLNRDFMKLASPEARALVALLRDVDPHVVLDLHTTDGTPMGYALTYAPPLAPATPAAVDRELWERWLPAVTDTLRARDDLAVWHYGNVPGAFGEPATAPRGWYSFSPQPRFSTNYVGLRGRFGILAEAYSYETFETRVRASRRFVEETIAYAARHATRLRRLAAVADAEPVAGRDVAVRATFAALPERHEVLLGRVDTVAHPVTGEPRLRSTGERIAERMPAFVRFAATETVRAPAAYLVSGPDADAVRRVLEGHGIAFSTVALADVPHEAFVVDSVRVAERPFQGVRQQDVAGRWRAADPEPGPPPRAAPALLVPTDGPLGRLVVALLDPRSDDGVVAWGLVDVSGLAAGSAAPIGRVPVR